MTSTKVVRSAVVLGTVGLALAACSGNSASSGGSSSASAAPASGNGTLIIGTLLPQTGSWPSSARPSSPASTWPSRRSTPPGA